MPRNVWEMWYTGEFSEAGAADWGPTACDATAGRWVRG